jgi:hypothetical protein
MVKNKICDCCNDKSLIVCRKYLEHIYEISWKKSIKEFGDLVEKSLFESVKKPELLSDKEKA